MQLTISGYSTALFSTWYFVEQLGICLDAGDGMTSQLMQKSRKIKQVFISHADRDHLTGLLMFNQLNARADYPEIYFPKDSNSFSEYESFSKKFDPQVSYTQWKKLSDHQEVIFKDRYIAKAFRNNHVKTEPHLSKSLGYSIFETKQKLKPEFTHLSKEELLRAKQKLGKDHLTFEERSNILSYSGDTPVDYEVWKGSKILIHEATFLESVKENPKLPNRNAHSNLEDVIKMASLIHLDTLILGHFSSRYSKEEIDGKIRLFAKKYNITFPIRRVIPGKTHFDILNEDPVN